MIVTWRHFSWLCAVAAIITGCASGESFNIETDKAMMAGKLSAGQPNCTVNLTLTGSEARGFSFSTFDEFPDLPRKKALQNVIAYMFSQGWTIFNTDSDLGVVSATTDILQSDGRAAQFSVVITEGKDGTKVECSTSTAASQAAFEGIVKREFCRLIEAAAD